MTLTPRTQCPLGRSWCLVALALVLGGVTGLRAQPTWTLTPPQQTVAATDPGTQVCIGVDVSDFVDILYFNAEFTFDSTVLRFDSVSNFGALPEFDVVDHLRLPDGVSPGRFRLEWSLFSYVPGRSEIPTTIPDGGRMIDLCFTAIGPAGSYSAVEITNVPRPTASPDPYVISTNSATRDIGLHTADAVVAIGAAPILLDVSDATAAATGEVVCVDLRAAGGFTDVRAFEFFLRYDPSALTFANASSAVPGLSGANVQLLNPGTLRVTKEAADAVAVSVIAGAPVLTLCFETKRDCDPAKQISDADVVYADSTARAVTGDGGLARAILVDPGQIDVAPCDGGVIVTGQPTVGSVGDRRCVGIEASGFTGVTAATFVFGFDETLVRVEDVRPAAALSAALSYNVVGGVLTVQVNPTGPISVPKVGALFDICVEILGDKSTIVPFEIDPIGTVVVGPTGPLSQGGGAFVVILPNSVPTLTLASAEAVKGTEVCLELTVDGFENLNSFRTSIQWDERVIRLLRVNDLGALPRFERSDPANNVQYNAQYSYNDEVVTVGTQPVGRFGINWSANGVNQTTFQPDPDLAYSETLPDGTAVFELCFEVVGEPGACTSLDLAPAPTSAIVDTNWVYLQDGFPYQQAYPPWCRGDSTVTRINPETGLLEKFCGLNFTTFETLIDRTSTAGWNGGLLVNEGFVCSAYDSAWVLRFPETAPLIAPTGTCFEATLERYLRMDSTRFSVAFDETRFDFVSLNPIRALDPVTRVDLSRVADGLLGVELEHYRPRTLSAGQRTLAFEFCFAAKPGPPECAPLAGSDDPVERFGYANRKERAVLVVDGEMCRASLDPPEPVPDIRPVSCAGQSDASITLVFDDALRNFTYFWTTDNGTTIPDPTLRNLTGLSPGTYTLRITDEDGYNPDIPAFTYVVPVARPAPVAMVADTATAPCNDAGPLVVPANATDAFGGTIAWRALGGGTVVADAATATPSLTGAGAFEVTVTSPGGCIALDTISVGRRISSRVTAPADQVLTCAVTEVSLAAAVADLTDDVLLEWTATAGGVLPTGQPTDDATLSGVTDAGTYTLTSTNVANGCTDAASVEVTVDRPSVAVSLPAPDSLNCLNDGRVALSSDVTSDVPGLTFEWSAVTGAIDGATDGPTATATAAGEYRLTVIDPATGCFDAQTVTVTDSYEAPVADAGADVTLNCLGPTPTLAAGVPGARRYTYAWTGPAGGITGPQDRASATATAGGTYELTVTDADNGCSAEDRVEVLVDLAVPTITVPPTQTLTCARDEITLFGGASLADAGRGAPTEAGWIVNPAGAFAPGATAEEAIVSEAGTFYYGATDPVSGCRDSASVTVVTDQDRPTVNVAAPEQLDCDTDEVTLAGSGPGAGFSVSWTTDAGGELDPATASQYIATARAAGTYTLTVRDNATGCASSQTVDVTADVRLPEATLEPLFRGDCDRSAVTLDVGGGVLASPGDYTFRWDGPVSALAAGPTTTTTQEGRHRLVVTRTTTACETALETEVRFREPPVAGFVAEETQLRCGRDGVTLRVLPASLASGQSISWEITTATGPVTDPTADPADPARYTATAEGTYRLVLTATDAENGTCVTRSEPVVIEDLREDITADVGPTLRLTCAEDATVTAAPAGTNPAYEYRWASPGGADITDADAHAATFSVPGIYELEVTNPASGCAATASLEVLAPDLSRLTIDIPEERFVLGCEERRTLNAQATADGGISELRWNSGSPQGPLLALGNDIEVDRPGRYFATVVEEGTSCAASDSIVVDQVTPFELTALTDDRLECNETSLTVSATVDNPSDLTLDYVWGALDGGTVVSGGTTPTAELTAGRYELRVADADSGCEAIETVTVESAGVPEVDAGPSPTITCDEQEVRLAASGSAGGYSYAWTTSDGELGAGTETELQAIATTPGEYLLTIRNDVTGCASSDVVTVGIDTASPRAILDDLTVGNCYREPFALRLGGEVAVDTAAYTYAWSGPDGGPVGTRATVTVTAEGEHVVEITRLRNGCSSAASTTVTWRERPTASFAVDTAELICGRDSVTLTLSAASRGSGDLVSWEIADSTGAFAPPRAVAGSPGDYRAYGGGAYRLVLTSPDGACVTASAPIGLRDSRTVLPVNAGLDLQLTCRDTILQAAPVPLADARWRVRWTGADEDVIASPTSLNVALFAPGTYTLTVTDPATRCSGSDVIEVLAPVTQGLQAELPAGFELGCDEERVVQVTAGTPAGGDASIAWWESATPNLIRGTEARYVIAAAGRYFAEVTDENTGCTALDSIDVTQVTPFTSEPIGALTLNCAQSDTVATLLLDNQSGLRVAYSWAVAGGDGQILDGATAATARLTPGTYEVTARDLDGSCAVEESVTVEPYTGWVATAEASATVDDCLNALTLSGTPSDTMASRWTLVRGSLPGLLTDEPVSTLLDPEVGSYRLTYELVPDFCPPSAPVEVAFEILPEPRINLFDAAGVSSRDLRDTTIQLISSRNDRYFATLDSVAGEAAVTINDANRAGVREWTSDELEIHYTVCEIDCETRCKAVRYVLIRGLDVVTPDAREIGLPNTITPNNDGRNEAFVVDEIVNNPGRYPNARLTVINRWGSTLYTRQPYADQFVGKDDDGRDIPEGTYYYVLELDLTDDLVYKGHLSIFR